MRKSPTHSRLDTENQGLWRVVMNAEMVQKTLFDGRQTNVHDEESVVTDGVKAKIQEDAALIFSEIHEYDDMN